MTIGTRTSRSRLAVAALSFAFATAAHAASDTPSWTTNETEMFWASAASSATRIVTAPRLEKADAQKGEGMLEAFGTQYMPDAYDYYGKAREKAIEREQLLREKFPKGAESDTTGGSLYQKIGKATAKAISEYDRRHDELCHFYLMHKAGIMTDAELAELDELKICVMLPRAGAVPEWWKKPDAPKADELDFARKYKPETFAAYERLKAIYGEGVKQYCSLLDDAIVLDAVRCGGVLAPLAARLAEVSGKLQSIAKTLSEENLLHEVEEITAEQLFDSDSKFGIAIRAFEKTLPVRDYAKNWLAWNWTETAWRDIALREAPVFGLSSSMVSIPGKDYTMCKYEVTQTLWFAVMGENPSRFKGADLPVECVSWNDCQKFLEKLNALPEVKAAGFTYRLPTADEWEFACRAGATGDYCKLADGTEITWGTLGEVAWYEDNSKIDGDGQTHPVGQKKSNAFGLYDMHGNVWEWTSTADGSDRVVCGGSWGSRAHDCRAGCRNSYYPDSRGNYRGFRLVLKDANLARKAAARAEAERKAAARAEAEREEAARKEIGEQAKGAVAKLAADMVAIPGKDYSMCKYEVTQTLWFAVTGEAPSWFKGADLPVEKVSWDDCQEFLEKLNALPEVRESGFTYRLPTADEWEYACRAGATGDYCKLADSTEITKDTLREVAWYRDNSNETHPVGTKKSNAFGLYDMHGNVWEWTSTADGGGRVNCGGGWNYNAINCKAGYRYSDSPDSRDSNLGFRLAR